MQITTPRTHLLEWTGDQDLVAVTFDGKSVTIS